MRITDEALHRGGRPCPTATSADRFLPDKAVDLIDEAAIARAHPGLHRAAGRESPGGRAWRLLQIEETGEAVAHQDYEKAAGLRDQERAAAQVKSRKRRTAWEQAKRAAKVDDGGRGRQSREIVASVDGYPRQDA